MKALLRLSRATLQSTYCVIGRTRNNILALLHVSMGALASFLLINVFGATVEADAYFVAAASYTVIVLLLTTLCDQFLFHYHALRRKNEEEANTFACFVTTISFIAGLLGFCGICLLEDRYLSWLAAGAGGSHLFVSLLRVLALSLIVDTNVFVLSLYLNARKSFSVPFLTQVFPNLFVVLTLVYFQVSGSRSLNFLAYARVAAAYLAFAALLWRASHNGLRYRPVLKNARWRHFFCDSIRMKSGTIHNLAFIPITNRILLGLSPGAASYFYLAQKLALAIQSVVTGPAYRAYITTVSEYYSFSKIEAIPATVANYIKSSTRVYCITAAIAIATAPFALHLLDMSGTISAPRFTTTLFFVLVWFFMIVIESPVLPLVRACNRYRVFLIVNSAFIVCYTSLCLILMPYFKANSIAIAAAIAQALNIALYVLLLPDLLPVPAFWAAGLRFLLSPKRVYSLRHWRRAS